MKAAWEKTGHLVIIAGTIGLVYWIGSNDWGEDLQNGWYWMIVVMVAFVLLIGQTANDRLDGVLIDWRNKMSLSRLQVILWTILGMSAFIIIGMARINMDLEYDTSTAFDQAKSIGEVDCMEDIKEEDVTKEVLDGCPQPDALQITFPEELLMAMGISVVSFAGSAMVKRSQSNVTIVKTDEEERVSDEITIKEREKEKASKEVIKITKELDKWRTKLKEAEEAGEAEDDIKKANEQIASLENDLQSEKKKAEDAVKFITVEGPKKLTDAKKKKEEAKGLLHVNENPKDAKWSDLFTKELLGEIHLIDLSKLQMFFFTIVVIFAYAATLNKLMQQPEMINNPFGVMLPLFSSSLVVLLGISHGGYLAIKGTNTSATNAQNGDNPAS